MYCWLFLGTLLFLLTPQVVMFLAVSSYLVVAILWPSGKHGYTLGNDRDET